MGRERGLGEIARKRWAGGESQVEESVGCLQRWCWIWRRLAGLLEERVQGREVVLGRGVRVGTCARRTQVLCGRGDGVASDCRRRKEFEG